MLLDGETLDLAPRAAEVIGALGGDPRFKLEMPAAQLEIVTAPSSTVGEAARELARARADLERGRRRLPGRGRRRAPVRVRHRAAQPRRALRAIGAEYARRRAPPARVRPARARGGPRRRPRARRLQRAARRTCPSWPRWPPTRRSTRAATAGWRRSAHGSRGLLPRQGVPPAFESFEAYEGALRWCGFDDPRQWWWELRLHPTLGTVEVRVPDTQRTVAETAAIGGFVHALVKRLAERHDAGERLPVAEAWRIDQNRWSACRHGLEGELLDLAYRRAPRARASGWPRSADSSSA